MTSHTGFYRQLMAIAIMPAIHQDLHDFVHYWNSHYIRKPLGQVAQQVALMICTTCHTYNYGINNTPTLIPILHIAMYRWSRLSSATQQIYIPLWLD